MSDFRTDCAHATDPGNRSCDRVRRAMKRTQPERIAPMFFDTLESRCLMSATITAPLGFVRPVNRFNLTFAPAANVLNVVGTNGNDQIRITRTPTQLVVNVN